jgi:hypothetical protein
MADGESFYGVLAMSLPWAWKRRRSRSLEDLSAVPAGVSVSAQPVLTPAEAEFYNLLKLTVQDRYLVLSQVPVWCLVEVRSAEETLRRSMLGKIALKRVDFVLIHPGTLTVAKVVELKPPAASSNQQIRDRLLEAVFKQAGIEQVRIAPKAGSGYTVPMLASLLGVEPLE